ncbi:MAG: PQQ-like beta-propeller repeat protein, partial [Gemmataceae bacterium]|nr:PQQ-like beta-propeller repeat protein [Gemmataceae bacterium]
PPASADWPQWLGPTRDGRAPAGPLRTDWAANPPKPLWEVEVGGGYSSVAVVGGKVYIHSRSSGSEERVICLHVETGTEVWQYGYHAGPAGQDARYATGPRATPSVADGRVYTVGGAGRFLCLEPPALAGGSPRVAWEHDLPGEFRGRVPQWGYAGSPLVDGDLVIVQPGGRDGSVVAFDKRTGEVRWKAGSEPAGYSSPVATTAGGVRVVLALTAESLLCVRAADGEVTARFPWSPEHGGNIATPLVLGDRVFVTAAYHMGCALVRLAPAGDRVGFEPVYTRRRKPLRCHHSTPVARGRHLWGFDGHDPVALTCFDVVAGQPVAGWEADRVGKGSLVLAGDHLVILTEGGELVLAAASAEEYRELGRVRTGLGGGQVWALPVLLDGRLYVRGDGKLICYDLRP